VSTPGPSSPVVDAEVRGVRRIFLVALAAALLAAAVAFTIQLANNHDHESGAAVSLLPSTFHQPGFVDRVVHRVAAVQLPATTPRGALRMPGGGTLYVVARCDTGRIRVVEGNLTSGQACTGKPVGVVALAQLRRAVQLDVTVSRPQKAGWAVGIYR
jgi:hypothetical protein